MLRNVPNHEATSVSPSVFTQKAGKQVFMKSNIWEFHENLLAHCAGFGQNDTGSRTTSRDKRTLCISSGPGCVMLGAKSGAEVVHRNVWFSPTHFSRQSYDLSTQSDYNQLSLRYAVLSQLADMPTAPTGAGNWSLSPRQGTYWAHISSHCGILCPPFLTVGHTGPTFLTLWHTGSTVPDSGTYWAHHSRYWDILGPQFLTLGHT
jgi:hypothetical protein